MKNKEILILITLLLIKNSYLHSELIYTKPVKKQQEFEDKLNMANESFINVVSIIPEVGNIELKGNGILAKDSIENLKNYFLISSAVVIDSRLEEIELNGNGILQKVNSDTGISSINKIENIGYINGYLAGENLSKIKLLYASNGVANVISKSDGGIASIENKKGVISGYHNILSLQGIQDIASSSNGILSNASGFVSTIGTIENTGKISGFGKNISLGDNSKVSYSGNGIINVSNKESLIEKIDNKGLISGKVISNASKLNHIQNTSSNFYLRNKDYAAILIIDSGNGIINVNNSINMITDSNVVDAKIRDINNSGYINGFTEGKAKGSVVTTIENSIDNTTVYLHGSGNGINNSSDTTYNSSNPKIASKIENVNNNGKISGYAYGESAETLTGSSSVYIHLSGNGLSSRGNSVSSYGESSFGDINNEGVISGYAKGLVSEGKLSAFVNIDSSGNGIIARSSGTNVFPREEKIDNEGVISGYVDGDSNEFFNGKDYKRIHYSGNGIFLSGDISGSQIINSGVIKGSQAAIGRNLGDTSSIIQNYGVIAGRSIISSSSEIAKNNTSTTETINNAILSNSTVYTNMGVEIKLKTDATYKVEKDSEGDVVISNISNGNAGNYLSKEILNASVTTSGAKDSYIKIIESTKNYDNYIVNGAGIKEGVLTLAIDNQKLTLKDTTVNAYKTALKISSNSNSFVSSNSIINGGGLENKDAIIEILGDNNKGEFISSKINGDIQIDGDMNTIYISNSSLINGNITSEKEKNNSLYLGISGESEDLNIFHEINNIKNIETNGKVTFFENSKINGDTDIRIQSGLLLVRLDGQYRDNLGRVIGHAFYNHSGEIKMGDGVIDGSDLPNGNLHPDVEAGAKLIFKASGLGNGTVIAMNGTDVRGLDDSQMGTYSLVHTARKFVNGIDDHLLKENMIVPFNLENKVDVVIDTLKLDEIIGEDEVENEEDLGEVWDEIVKKGDDINLDLDIENRNPNEVKKELISILDQIYANNPYTYLGDASKENMYGYFDEILKTKMPKYEEWIIEGHEIFSYHKYGTEKQRNSFGGHLSFNEYEANLKTYGSFITAEYGIREETSLGFALGGSKQKLNLSKNSKFDGNLAYLALYGKKNIDNFRITAGLGYQYGDYKVDRFLINRYQVFENKGKLSTNTLGFFGEGRYFFKLRETLTLEPKVILKYALVNQEKVVEDDKPLSMEVKSHNYNDFSTEIGMDLVKLGYVDNGKIKLIGGLSYVTTYNRDREYLKGSMSNDGEFRIKGPAKDINAGKLLLGVDYEKVNGWFFNNYNELEVKDMNSTSIKIKIGIGYRF